MEIRNALQKIENYLTVVSNLNKTILSEGTMSRDELLLMKKYLYTSIDRIEDIERSLIIDKKSDKTFTPAATYENELKPSKEKEIVAVQETDHIEDVEAKLTNDMKVEFEDMVEDIQTEILAEQKEIVGEVERPKMFQQEVTELPVVENIITEDYSLNRNAVEENTVAETEVIKSPVMENIITEDYSLNRNSTEENIVSKAITENEKITTIIDLIPLVENIITEDYSLNRNVAKESIVAEITPETSAEVKPANSFYETYKAEVNNENESITEKFEENKPKTFAEVLADNKKNETSYIEQLEQQTNTKPQSQLFQLFDDGKEDLHESFAGNNKLSEPLNTGFEKPVVNTAYGLNENVLVAEKEVETLIEELTPSSLNNVFKPQILIENTTVNACKTLSESIALNDKFIFVRELFGNQFDEYENSLKHIDTLSSFYDAEQYCNTKLWNKFNWTERASAAGRFMDLIQKKYK